LLQTALDHSPIAILLVNPLDRILYANQESRRLFTSGRKLQGMKFSEIAKSCPKEMQQVMGSTRDGVFSVETEDQTETYHLAERSFFLNRREHRLYLLRRMTAELSRQEAEIWKRVIRIISHELNNSLAPISSLAHSGMAMARDPEQITKLEPLYNSIQERVDHLTEFLEGYARFARLPQPQMQTVRWADWLEGPGELYAFQIEGQLPSRPGQFDPSQMQQAMINLLKNAVEASSADPEIAVAVIFLQEKGFRIQVKDRGCGMDEVVMRQALLPFYSTKSGGSGVGLALCREIVEAHGGSIRIQSRSGGGTVVTLWLPASPAAAP
jgi:two-component system nitrogen regulation sensor histidine kinase NtrY